MKRKTSLMMMVIVLSAISATAFLGRQAARGRRASGPLVQNAYVWQRHWGEEVRAALRRSRGSFDGFVLLTAEVDWEGTKANTACVEIDCAGLQDAAAPVGLALRIGPYAGPFAEKGVTVESLAALAVARLEHAAACGLTPCELQIDFDCATSRLDGYRLWVGALRRRIAPTPLVITVLPTWLDSPAFKRLVAATDGFVLQVHSLAAPRSPEQPMTLCDPATARRAVERAGQVGVPFRVALATYGYCVAFDPQGRCIGLQADGPALTWPSEAQLRVLRADPAATADLVRHWSADRPASMRGVIWYRLPTDVERLNWRWPTLVTVMAGRVPQARLEVNVRYPEPGLVEIDLVNSGDADSPLPAEVTAAWTPARHPRGDGLGGFELDESGPTQARFRPGRDGELQWLAAGQRCVLGWLRFDSDTEVDVHVTPAVP